MIQKYYVLHIQKICLKKYCRDCKMHFCNEDKINCHHILEEIEKAKDKDINIIKKKKNYLIEKLLKISFKLFSLY